MIQHKLSVESDIPLDEGKPVLDEQRAKMDPGRTLVAKLQLGQIQATPSLACILLAPCEALDSSGLYFKSCISAIAEDVHLLQFGGCCKRNPSFIKDLTKDN